jgi:hypothetical protein
MKTYKIIKVSDLFSTSYLCTKVERLLAEKTSEGHKVVSIAFGTNLWQIPTAFITLEIEVLDEKKFV